jgi:siroheme synthase
LTLRNLGRVDEAAAHAERGYAKAQASALVFYMGVSRLAAIGEGLIGLGRDASTPVAIVENGSRADQRDDHITSAALDVVPACAVSIALRCCDTFV